MTSDTGVVLVDREVRVAAPPQAVFEFFTDAQKLASWIGVRAEVEARPGGGLRIEYPGQDVAIGEFVAVEPPTRVVFTWGWEGDGHPLPPGASTVEVTFTLDGDGTLVHLVHGGLSAELAEAHDEGWARYLARLSVAATGGNPGPDAAMS